MNLDSAQKEILRLFETGVAGPLLIEPVPDGTDGPESDPWARVTATIASRRQVSLGVVGKYRVNGYATVQLFFPANHGQDDVTIAIMAVMQAYTGHKTNGVRWYEPAQPINSQNDKYIQWNVVCPFEYEELS